jgi:hypothetical protein
LEDGFEVFAGRPVQASRAGLAVLIGGGKGLRPDQGAAGLDPGFGRERAAGGASPPPEAARTKEVRMTESSGVIKVLGLHMSPRLDGSSAKMLNVFADGVEKAGAKFKALSVSQLDVRGCMECGHCSEKGECAIDFDDMNQIYSAWEEAQSDGKEGVSTKIVIATPVFFYDMPSQGKAVLDRSQAFWTRRYVLGKNADGVPGSKGFLLACGATKGKDLFMPVTLAVKYLFDAIGFPKSFPTLSYRGIERPEKFSPDQLAEIQKAGYDFVRPPQEA